MSGDGCGFAQNVSNALIQNARDVSDSFSPLDFELEGYGNRGKEVRNVFCISN